MPAQALAPASGTILLTPIEGALPPMKPCPLGCVHLTHEVTLCPKCLGLRPPCGLDSMLQLPCLSCSQSAFAISAPDLCSTQERKIGTLARFPQQGGSQRGGWCCTGQVSGHSLHLEPELPPRGRLPEKTPCQAGAGRQVAVGQISSADPATDLLGSLRLDLRLHLSGRPRAAAGL